MATSTAASTVVSALSANFTIFGIFFGFFLLFRMKFIRIYLPKSMDILPPKDRVRPLPKDPFRWLFIILTKKDSYILKHVGLDGYLFIRFLRVFGIFFICSILICAILFPVNAAGSKKSAKGIDKLAIGAVKDESRYYAHVFVGWVFYGSLIFVIFRELFFYNSLRAVIYSTPKYARKLSSRTVLFQAVPDIFLDRKQFFKLFNGVRRIYVARQSRRLEFKVRRREALVQKLEVAENKLLAKAVKAKKKADKKENTLEPSDDLNTYVPEKKRPRMGLFHKKDIIAYCKEEIPKIDREVKKLQKAYHKFRPMNSIFVEFNDQYTAQLALQTTQHHTPFSMSPAFTGMEPGDVYWPNLRLFWWERIARRAVACAALVALIIFCALPVAFIGVVSNITYLTNKLPWLKWIMNMPDQLLGIITGILPSALLTLLNMFLPIFIRYLARVSGCPSFQHVELYTQDGFFSFLLVNTFLLTAFSSSASSVVTQIVEDPYSAMNLLAQNLPKSSNFFIAYIILQGLTVSSGTLGQVIPWIIYYILGGLIDNTVRKKWARLTGLGPNFWGTTYPLYTILCCITIAFAIIAPFILVFTGFAFIFLYIAFLYTFVYVTIEAPDMRGLSYAKALFHLFIGIYIGQVAMLGIFVVGKGWGSIVLQAIGLGFTVFCHVELKAAFDHLIHVIPTDCMTAQDGLSHTPSFIGSTEYKSEILDKRYNKLRDRKLVESLSTSDFEKPRKEYADLEKSPDSGPLYVPLLADRDNKSKVKDNFLVRFLRPDAFASFKHCRSLIPDEYYDETEIVDNSHAYDPPVVSSTLPGVWIPADPMGFSKKEVEEHSSYINISDENAGFDEKGRIVFYDKPPN